LLEVPVTEAPPLRAVAVDDETAAREVIRLFLERDSRVSLVGEAGNGDDAIALVRSVRPDLLFLDIQMPDTDGFGVLEALSDDLPAGIIFVTAHDDHALRAFEVHALDYLLKPFGQPRFKTAVDRAIRALEAEHALDMKRTVDTLVRGRHDKDAEPWEWHPETSVRPHRIGVRSGSRTVLVDLDEIDWVRADGDYARIHVGEDDHLVSRRMSELERLLDPSRFVRIHRSVIVRMDRVRELRRDADGGGLVVLEGGVRLRVARSRWAGLEAALGLG
jgi:two-component system LytT family response regulator